MKERTLHRLVELVRRTGRQEELWSRGDRIVVAVSGGADSTVLLHIMRKIAADEGLELICAHLNHGLRGGEADRDADFVRELAQRLAIPFELGYADVLTYRKESGKGLELAAREKDTSSCIASPSGTARPRLLWATMPTIRPKRSSCVCCGGAVFRGWRGCDLSAGKKMWNSSARCCVYTRRICSGLARNPASHI
ncbi:hypothetical protein HMSSN036_61250 [Paenibacillus macerans]|nr:hypothetical protein HMSSN036_61250 [Paenibacillus macerans]